MLGVAQISIDQVEHIDNAELKADDNKKHIPDRVAINQRLEEIENKINEIVNVGNLECFV